MDAFSRLAKGFIPDAVKGSRLYKTVRHALLPHDDVYNQTYYDGDVEPFAAPSASVMAASIVDRFRPKTVIDVGCGTGALLAAFRKLNCEVRGFEHAEAGRAYCQKRGLSVRQFNIEKDTMDDEQYDLAVSFEVAEHLPAWTAKRYVGLLCRLSPLVIMSAATPGQGGIDHINEQPHSYWQKKFESENHYFDEATSRGFSMHWKSADVASFYYDNVMVFVRR